MSEPVKEGDKSIADCHGVMRLAEPPEKKRFKQSWTQEEHHRFLEAMRRFGKGNWKKVRMGKMEGEGGFFFLDACVDTEVETEL